MWKWQKDRLRSSCGRISLRPWQVIHPGVCLERMDRPTAPRCVPISATSGSRTSGWCGTARNACRSIRGLASYVLFCCIRLDGFFFLNSHEIKHHFSGIFLRLKKQHFPRKYAKLPLVPTLVSPEGEGLQDSTPIMEQMELRFPERSIYPKSALGRFMTELLEEFGDEWGNWEANWRQNPWG